MNCGGCDYASGVPPQRAAPAQAAAVRQLHGRAQQQNGQVQRARCHLCRAVAGAQAGALQAVIDLRVPHARMLPSNISDIISCTALLLHRMHRQVCCTPTRGRMA